MKNTLIGLTLVSAASSPFLYVGYLANDYYSHPQVVKPAQKPKSELYELLPAPTVEYSVGQVYLSSEKSSLNQKNMDCLAKNIYFESAHQTVARLSIAQVTMNRLASGKWGDSVCSVVMAKSQFSWTHLTDHKVSDKNRWQASVDAAKAYLDGARVKGLENVMYYHGDYIPLRVWAKKMKIVLRDGGHLFFAN